MSITKSQSAIQEVKDQLFLDTADNDRLSAVTDNIGLERPRVGLSDNVWRAAAKEIGLQRKLVRNAFHRTLEICLGPRKSRIATLAEDAAIGATEITLVDAGQLIQLGTLVLSSGTASEETVDFCFRDLKTNTVTLNQATTFAHTALAEANSFLSAGVSVSATSLVLIDSANFPTTGFPYNIILDRGTPVEEIVSVSANTVATNTLTCSATAFAHSGPNTPVIRKPLELAAPAGRTFLVLDTNDTRTFPSAGFVRLAFGGGGEEVAEYIENDASVNTLYLKRPLQNSHAAAESVELIAPGAAVETVSALQQGQDWEVFVTSPRTVKIFLPTDTQIIRALDASWIHKEVPASPGATTTTAVVSIGDLEIPVTSVRGFVDEGDLIDIDTGAETAFYIRRDSGDPVEISANAETYTLSDGQTLTVSVDGAAADTATFNTGDFVDISNATAAEVAAVINTDVADCAADVTSDGKVRITSDTWPASATASIEVTGGTANPALGFLTPTLILSKALTAGHSSGVDIDAISVAYAGTDLEEGNLRNGSGVVVPNMFPGPYLFDVTQRSVSEVTNFLDENIPFPTKVVVNQVSGAACLEVEDASSWPAPAFTPFSVRIGRETGFQEDRTVSDRTLKAGTTTTVNAGTSPGDSSITGADTTGFPESAGPALYRIIIDQGGANEETAVVSVNTAGTPGTFDVQSNLAIAHLSGESIELLADVLTFDALTQPHEGATVSPTTVGHPVEPLIDSIDLVDASTFPDSGTIWINFGKERVNVRKKIVSMVSDTIVELEETDNFPTGDFPYLVKVSAGRPEQEIASVTANDTGTDRLTFSPALTNTQFQAAAQVWQVDDPAGAPGYVDETTDFNDAGANDVDPWPLVEAIGDHFAIGFADTFTRLTIDVGTAGVGGTMTWRYWDGASWTALTGVVDGTSEFTASGRNEVTFALPGNWTARTLNGSASLFYVVAEVDTVYSTNPIITQGWVGLGHQIGSYVEFISGDPVTVDYDDKDTNTLNFTSSEIFPTGFTDGESVILSTGFSSPDPDGLDYPFLMPPDPARCVELLLELIRGAGIQIEFLTDK